MAGNKKPAPGAPAPEVKEEKRVSKADKKSQKERPKSKKKHTKVQVWTKYKVDGDKITRTNESCTRCGQGTFLAKYQDRTYCGKCGWSKTSSKESNKKEKN